MLWIPLIAWVAAVVVALVVLGFCAYEIWLEGQAAAGATWRSCRR